MEESKTEKQKTNKIKRNKTKGKRFKEKPKKEKIKKEKVKEEKTKKEKVKKEKPKKEKIKEEKSKKEKVKDDKIKKEKIDNENLEEGEKTKNAEKIEAENLEKIEAEGFGKKKENLEEVAIPSEGKEKLENEKTSRKLEKILIYIANIIMIIAIIFMLFILIRPKFKNVSIELGTQEINIEDFLVSSLYKKKAEFITDMSQIDLSKVGEIEIILAYNKKEQTVKLNIVDTTAPNVTFQNIEKSRDYELKAEDFIVEKSDLSPMQVTILEAPDDISEYKDYKVKISVKDIYGNETIGENILSITWLVRQFHQELGEELNVSQLVMGVQENESMIPQSELEKIDTSVPGEYEIKIEYNGKEYTSKIIVQDTTPPELELTNITIYDDEKIEDYTEFIDEVSDASGKPTTSLKTQIDYTKVGEQEIVIEAVDAYGNKTEKTAILTIQKDTEGPVISGLTTLTVEKNSQIDYYSGVRAIDDKDGRCEVTVNSNSVNVSAPGTYYATYTSKDSKGNTTTKRRKIVVNHNQEDTNAKLDEFYNNYCAGKDPVGMARAIREQISYSSNWGGSDPVWHGLTQGSGNCYVHAMIMQRCLQKAGYATKIIYLTDESHYWNIVNVNGTWWHIDATPSVNHTLGLLTNEQKLADAGLHGKTWDIEKWPELN